MPVSPAMPPLAHMTRTRKCAPGPSDKRLISMRRTEPITSLPRGVSTVTPSLLASRISSPSSMWTSAGLMACAEGPAQLVGHTKGTPMSLPGMSDSGMPHAPASEAMQRLADHARMLGMP
jgi:hypothetical protein